MSEGMSGLHNGRRSLGSERRFRGGYVRFDRWSYLSGGKRLGTRRLYLKLPFGYIELEAHRPCRCLVGTVGVFVFGKRAWFRLGDHDIEAEEYRRETPAWSEPEDGVQPTDPYLAALAAWRAATRAEPERLRLEHALQEVPHFESCAGLRGPNDCDCGVRTAFEHAATLAERPAGLDALDRLVLSGKLDCLPAGTVRELRESLVVRLSETT